jgi:hypothetical protein
VGLGSVASSVVGPLLGRVMADKKSDESAS